MFLSYLRVKQYRNLSVEKQSRFQGTLLSRKWEAGLRAHIVTRANRARYTQLLDEMHRQRHKLFVEQLGWVALRSTDGREIDEYDDDNAVYLLTINAGGLVGSMRLLPSWRRSLMADKLPFFVEGEMPVGPDIWEWTRWAPGVDASPRLALKSRSILFAAAMEFALSRGVEMFTAVVDPKYIPLMIDLGWWPQPCGMPKQTAEGATAVALKWRLGARDLSNIRHAVHVPHTCAIEAPLAMDEAPCGYDVETFAELACFAAPDAATAIAHSLRAATDERIPQNSIVRV